MGKLRQTMSNAPQPTTANAEAHRQEDEDDTDQDLASVPNDMKRTGRDGGGGGGGGGRPGPGDGDGGGGASIVTNALSNKRLVGFAALAAGAALLYLYYKNQGPTENPTDLEDIDDKNGGGDGGGGGGGGRPDNPPGQPNIEQPPNDPLVADDQAFDWVFGDDPRADSDHPHSDTVSE